MIDRRSINPCVDSIFWIIFIFFTKRTGRRAAWKLSKSRHRVADDTPLYVLTQLLPLDYLLLERTWHSHVEWFDRICNASQYFLIHFDAILNHVCCLLLVNKVSLSILSRRCSSVLHSIVCIYPTHFLRISVALTIYQHTVIVKSFFLQLHL